MKSIRLGKFLSLEDAENFMNSFEDVVKWKLIPLFVQGINSSNIVYFVMVEYLIKD